MNSEGTHYFDAEPTVSSNRHQIELVLPDLYLTLTSDSGVFSSQRVDPGSRYLLQEMPELPDGPAHVLDLGCGYGPIALAVARRAPDATVWGIDVNERALALARDNAESNRIGNVSFCTPGDVPAELSFDRIVSNPPIRIGKEPLHELLSFWLDRLVPLGVAHLVVQKHLGSDSLAAWMNDSGWSTSRLASRKGYRILEVEHRAGTAT